MGVSLRESLKVGSYVLWHRLKGTDRFPLVLMLEPLFRCNLEVWENPVPSGNPSQTVVPAGML
jgi:hypothetical protein